ncbi:MAG: hypothetical protein HYZ69_01835, partial [Candidatus Colwellbacteria bacterium]|nr:hypothetical protein [Candidatus Colwellbacteria bacterium]
MAEIIWRYLNPGRLTPLNEALDLQAQLFQQKLNGDQRNYVLFVEHEPVYTCTPRAMRTQKIETLCKVPAKRLPAPLIELPDNHGGSITYHGPGQLVCYLILDLSQFGVSGVRFIRAVEESITE